jgi:phage-related protein
LHGSKRREKILRNSHQGRGRIWPAPCRRCRGRTPDIAKPLTGFGSGVLELALKHRGDAFRVVYALQMGDDIWIVHAFQKKSKSGISTPKSEIDLIRERIKRLKEALR